MFMMKISTQFKLKFFYWFLIFCVLFAGLWFIVISPLGPDFSRIPGDLGDARFNNYILEHDYRWLTGQDSSLWSAPFFYPYPLTLTFSDNHIGSIPFYSFFRWISLDRESTFQAWYILSYILNFCAAAFVLSKFGLTSLSVAIGSFFFTFGLPQISQEFHVVLFYRFCIPLACYYFYEFAQKADIKLLSFALFWVIWQFYFSIYLGFFLGLFLLTLTIGLSLIENGTIREKICFWPDVIHRSLKNTKKSRRIVNGLAIFILIILLFYLFRPYLLASEQYGFSRSSDEIQKMLPQVQSYFSCVHSLIWRDSSIELLKQIPAYQVEHQLFIGVSALAMIILGLVFRFKSKREKMSFIFMGSVGFLVIFTLNIDGFSLYHLIWRLPGINSIRAVSRIILVLMWPIALFIAVQMDAFMRIPRKKVITTFIGIFLFSGMICESSFFNHSTFEKSEAISRVRVLHEQITLDKLPDNPILISVYPDSKEWYVDELDAMLLAQDLGWPVMNGYSGNFPPGYGSSTSCDSASSRVREYLDFTKSSNESFYNETMNRIVTIRSEDCKQKLYNDNYYGVARKFFPEG